MLKFAKQFAVVCCLLVLAACGTNTAQLHPNDEVQQAPAVSVAGEEVMIRWYTKVHNMWPNHDDTYDLNRRGNNGMVQIASGDTTQVVMDALAIEVTNEMPGAEAAVDADWDTVQHLEDWVAPE